MYSENIEYIFNSDCRYKKRVGTNVRHRASRKGYIRGGVKTTYDFLSAKERRKLNGDVKVSNKYDDLNNLPSWDELKRMSKEDSTRILEILQKLHHPKTLIKHWGVTEASLRNFAIRRGVRFIFGTKVHRVGVVENNTLLKGSRANTGLAIKEGLENKQAIGLNQINQDNFKNFINTMIEMVGEKLPVIEQQPKENSFNITLNKEGNKKEIENRLLAIAEVMSEESNYRISLKIEEI